MTDLSVRVELAAASDRPEVADKVDILRTIARIGQTCYGLDADMIRTGLEARDAHDGKPVDLIFALLSPQKAGVEHLKALAAVSRFLRDEHMVAKLRGASGQDALYALLNRQREQQAA